MANYVYISYSQKDSLFVNRLSNDLTNKGVNTWIDKKEIEPGQNWQKAIIQGLNNASLLLFVSSENSIESKWTIYELVE